jgi:hypothetical protein
MVRRLIYPLLAIGIAALLVFAGRAHAASPADGDGSDNSSAAFVRDATSDNTSAGDAQLATFFVATGNGTYVCILHPEWGTLTTPAPP